MGCFQSSEEDTLEHEIRYVEKLLQLSSLKISDIQNAFFCNNNGTTLTYDGLQTSLKRLPLRFLKKKDS